VGIVIAIRVWPRVRISLWAGYSPLAAMVAHLAAAGGAARLAAVVSRHSNPSTMFFRPPLCRLGAFDDPLCLLA